MVEEKKNMKSKKISKNYLQLPTEINAALIEHSKWASSNKKKGSKFTLKNKINFPSSSFTDLNLSKINLKGFEFENCLFKNIDFSKANLRETRFINCNFEENCTFDSTIFDDSVLLNLNFNNCNFKEIEFAYMEKINKISFKHCTIHNGFFPEEIEDYLFENCDLRGSDFESAVFRNTIIKNCNLDDVIFTNADLDSLDYKNLNLEKAIGVSSFLQKKLSNRDQELDKTKFKNKELEEEVERLTDISNQKLIEGFNELKTNFFREEKFWLSILKNSLIMLLISEIIIISLQFYTSNISYFITIQIILLSSIYFIGYQYSKAKNLRIENQYKIAIVKGYEGILIKEKDPDRISIFLSNVSDVLFSKPRFTKDGSIPINKIINAINKR